MDNNDRFDINSFRFPNVKFSPVYVWVWNDICTREIIDEQLVEMLNLGIRAFYILPEPKGFRPDSMPTSLEPDYPSEEFFELCAYAIKEGKARGMLCWIYDEGGWPSGSACGKVIEDHPEYAQQSLEFYEYSFSAGDVYRKSTPDILASFLNNTEIINDGFVFTEDALVTEYVIQKGEGRYPDLLNKEATEYFIEITHEKYVKALKNEFSDTVSAVFTDEPKAPPMPFNRELAEKYEATYGESILPYLPLIAKRIAPTEMNVHVLHQWYDLCSKMFCDNFLSVCRKWSKENGVSFTGHLDKDHNPLGCMDGGCNFNLMRALRCFDIPGIDVIWRQIYPESKTYKKDDINCYNGFFPRYASSAAAQNGTKRAMSEVFGVAGEGLTYDIMRYTVGYQAVRGINIFNPFNFPLGRSGQHLAQELPIYTLNQPYYRYLGYFNSYVERLCYIASIGERECETALYYPVSDFQGGLNAEKMEKKFESLGRALEDKLIDFDIIDDDIIQSAKIIDGCISIGRANYKKIIIPEGAYIPQATKMSLEEFIKHGVDVTHNITSLDSPIKVEGYGLRVMHRIAENADVFCLFRETGENEHYKIYLPSSKGYLLNLENGEVQILKMKDNVLDISLAIGETAVVLLIDEKYDAEKYKDFERRFEIPNEFIFSKDIELTCNEKGFENINHTFNAEPVILGDWSSVVGSAYSGSGIYEVTFSLPEKMIGKQGEINLGDVQYAADVYLNEQSLGVSLMPPYTLKIPEGVLNKNNTLRVVVTNTSANWYAHTDYFDKWKTDELSPYFEGEKELSVDYISGGLFGPVVIYTE